MKKILMFLMLLCGGGLCSAARGENKAEYASSESCKVLEIVNLDEQSGLQDTGKSEQTAASVMIGYNSKSQEVSVYWMDARYDFDLHSVQRGDSITFYYPADFAGVHKKAVAMENHSLQMRVMNSESIFIDVDFFDILALMDMPPMLENGEQFTKWKIAERRFQSRIKTDVQGLSTLDVADGNDLRLSQRTFAQLHWWHILLHNETVRKGKGERGE